ncbi:MAG: hypothetical protein AB7S38_15850 [Vulcanimicrobiota bacterium]
MAVLLVIPLLLGWLLARRGLGEADPLTAGALTVPLAVALTLLGVNGFYLIAGVDQAVFWTLGLQALACLGLWFVNAPETAPLPLGGPTKAFLIAVCLLIYLFSNAQQIGSPDDDFWIHSPLQGLMLHGNFPPYNPFFSDIPMNGHYGRNLSLVTVAYLTGHDTFKVQMVMTTLLQMATFLLLFASLRRATGSELQAVLGAGFLYFGINAGGRGGLIDTLQNNNPYVHLYLALVADMTLRLWSGSRMAAVVGGLVLGGYAIVYETHFGVCVLVLVGVTPILLALKRIPLRSLALVALMLGLAFPLAATQGGPLTNIVERRLAGHQDQQPEQLSKGMQNQAQVVKVTVPKENLFQILLETGEYQRCAYIYRLDTPLKIFYKPAPDRGYRYIWSWDVLRIHFLPLYLMPLSAVFLLRRGHPAGLFLGAFGLIAYLVPALVDFGPIYESEYYRWEFAAALGFTGALGLFLGAWLEELYARPGLDWTFDEEPGVLRLRFTTKGLAALLVIGLCALNSLACLSLVSSRLSEAWSKGLVGAALVFPSTPTWLESHAILDFDPVDYAAAHWLETKARPGQRLLTNFRQENNFSILFESTLTGVSGIRCVGHALPLDDEKIGTTPYHMAPPALAFWATRDPYYLRLLGVDWVYLRPTEEVPDLEGVEGLELAHEERLGPERRLVYRFSLPPVELVEPDGDSSLFLGGLELPAHARSNQVFPRRARVENRGTQAVALDGSLFYRTRLQSTGKESVPVEWVAVPLKEKLQPGQSLEVPLALVAPPEDGDYDLLFGYCDGSRSLEIPSDTGPLVVDFARLLAQVKIATLQFDQTRPSHLSVPRLELSYPDGFQLGQPVLASLAAFDPERREYDLLPDIHLRKLPLVNGPLELPAVMPRQAGSWFYSLYLSPEQGEVELLPGSLVEVR